MSIAPESKWSVEWWKKRHEGVYFPVMEWHKDWKVCPYPPPHVLDLLKPTKSDIVLEIGCGYGEWMVPLAPYVGQIHGTDIHKILKAQANHTFYKHGLLVNGKCKFYLTDGMSIPHNDSYFDAVYSISVFQHIPRATVRRYFAETARVLKSGGRYLFHFRHDDGQGEYSKDIEVDHDVKGKDFSTGWTSAEAMAEAERVGLTGQTLEEGGHSLFLYGTKP